MTPRTNTTSATLVGRLVALSDGIAEYLHDTLIRHGSFPARSFYGESFASLLLARNEPRYGSARAALRDLYRTKNTSDPDFHWEFNNYAWCTLCRETGDESLKEFVLPLRFRNTSVANWTLLRACTRYLAGSETDIACREAKNVLRRAQSRSGLICDQPNVRSFQYHCFSAVLAAEIHALSGETFFLDRFRRAAEFIERFVLRTGDALYIGRGQQQSFGYGALACLLALAFRRFGEPRYLAALTRCVSFLEGYRRSNGSFPLVLNGSEEGYPSSSSTSDPRFPGWYAYNNYFDYLPFLGVFLRKAADALEGTSVPNAITLPPQTGYRDANFVVFRTAVYEAVLSRPGGGWRGAGGYWTNDLPFPYIVRNGQRVTPSYGGEQFGSTLYSAAGIPLPTITRKRLTRPMRDGRIWSFFVGDRLIVLSPRGALARRIRFLEDEIIVDDVQVGAGTMFARYLFDRVQQWDERTFAIAGGAVLVFSVPMVLEDSGAHYWGGPLKTLVARRPTWRCTVHVRLRGLT